MDGRPPRPLPGAADPRRADRDRVARAARRDAQARRRAAPRGNTRVSVAIKYLTQSTWSHAMFYIGDALGRPPRARSPGCWSKPTSSTGFARFPLSEVVGLNTRVCRPVGLSKEDLQKVIQFAIARIGGRYDLKNVFDLARYLVPTPPVPTRWRRRMIAFGSGDPTRAICSTLIAAAFQSVPYPILPRSASCTTARPGATTATTRSCTSATTACIRRATSTSRRTSRW